MTFSIVARCDRTGQFGVAISSSSPAVAARCAHVRAGVGAVATQNVTNPRLGPFALDRLASGDASAAAIASALATDRHGEFRQLLVIGRDGAPAVWSGERILGTWATAHGVDCAAGGNLLAAGIVPAAMVERFESADGSLGDRLVAALQAGALAGGEAGPVHSAGLSIADTQPWPYADLRVDWLDDGDPIDALARAWAVYAPQADAYVTRALDPSAAPTYGVPGDR